jgi:hypothetical protein
MAGWLWHLGALGIVRALFWGTILSSSLSFATDRHFRSILKKHWRPILVAIVLALVWRIPPDGHFFHGLEYEDSYVYTVAARQMLEHTLTGSDSTQLPYSISICAAGSLTACRESESYPEHFIGDAYIISLCSRIVGYNPDIGSIASVIAACLACILIFLICMLISDDAVVASGASLVFAITPVFAVQGLEASAEPISNACISLVICLYLRFLTISPESGYKWNASAAWLAFTLSLLLSLTIKRENILLVICLPIVALLIYLLRQSADASRKWKLRGLLATSILAFAFSIQMRIIQTTVGETALLDRFPLTFYSMLTLLFVFVRSFFVVRWYGGGAILVGLGIIVTWRRKGFALAPLLLFISYAVLYALHIRSYYEMRSGHSDPREALRFSMSIMSLWSILAGLGVATMLASIRGARRYRDHQVLLNITGAFVLIVVMAVSHSVTKAFREDAFEDEFRIRVEPAMTAVRFASADADKPNYIITLEPLVIQMYARPNTNVLDLDFANGKEAEDLFFSAGKPGVVFLDERIHHAVADSERYQFQIGYLDRLQRTILYRNDVFAVVRLSSRDGN